MIAGHVSEIIPVEGSVAIPIRKLGKRLWCMRPRLGMNLITQSTRRSNGVAHIPLDK